MRRPVEPKIAKYARELRLKPTEAERMLWWHLRALNRRGYHFRRQAPFRHYILDFVEHRARVVIELDGSQHGHAENRQRDDQRDTFLKAENYRVLRFWNGEIHDDIDGVVEAILRAVKRN